MKKVARDLPHYVSLMGVVLVGIVGFIFFGYDKSFQMAIAFGVAGAYVVWGIVHHLIHRDFDLGVLAEYLAIAGLGLIIVFSLLIRA
jgi:uncharacterized membrane protein YsdA (DUF1294 family)